jgi:two-component system, NtrC family, sensor kinase
MGAAGETKDAAGHGAAMKRPGSIVLWMVATIVGIGVRAYWDGQRESADALEDFAREQVALARAAGGHSVEDPGRVVLVQTDRGLVATGGASVHAPTIEEALAEGRQWVRLSRPEAAALGLPERTAMAGIAAGSPPGGASQAVVVVATALRVRDRERRAQWRVALGFLVSSAIVLAFGTQALRRQRKELELSKELAVAAAVRAQEARLVQADKLATLGALGIGIAHEVATPLGVIVGRAEQLASRVEGDERATRAVEAITQQADRIDKLVRALLALARGGQTAFDRVAPAAIVADALELAKYRLDKRAVSLATRLEPDLPPVACDPKLFTQVIVNLLLNACDACEPGGSVDLRVSSCGGRVAFAVVDDGPGISPENAERATEPFFTTKPPGEGTGLGLAIAREIVMHHNGALRLAKRSDGRRGTEATVELTAAPEGPRG